MGVVNSSHSATSLICALAALSAALFAGCRDKDAGPAPTGSASAPVTSAVSAASASAAAPSSATAPAPKPAPKKADKIVILAGGDVNLGRGAGQKILKDPSYDPFSKIAPLLKTADYRFVNLESQLSDQGGETQSRSNHLVFTGPPGGAAVLARAGIDLVSLANNHAWDYGKGALFETLDHLDAAGVAHVGARKRATTQYEPLVVDIKGWKVAWFAATHIWNQGLFNKHQGRHYVAWASFDLLGKRLKKAVKQYDLVLVSYHGGGEYVEVPMQWTRDFYRAVASTGAHAIFGHHPHVPHGVGWVGKRPAFYSLGNLVFAMHSDYPWTGTSFFARVTFSVSGDIQVEACPYHILGHVPMLFDGKAKAARERAFVAHLKLLSMSTGGATVGEPGELSCVPVTPKRRPSPN
jgi:poly-gamma-glutamate synthesis protein (capsule biosynthesis protein)